MPINNVININQLRKKIFREKIKRHTEELADQFQLLHGGALSIFRTNTISHSFDTTQLIIGKVGKFTPEFPEDQVQETISKGIYLHHDTSNDIFQIGLLKLNTAYSLIYKNNGDNPEDVMPLLWALNQFFVTNDYIAA